MMRLLSVPLRPLALRVGGLVLALSTALLGQETRRWEVRVSRELSHLKVGDDDGFVSGGGALSAAWALGRAPQGSLWLSVSHRFAGFRIVSEDDEDHDSPEDVSGLTAFRHRYEYTALGLSYHGPEQWWVAPILGLEARQGEHDYISATGSSASHAEPLLLARGGLERVFGGGAYVAGVEGTACLHRFRQDHGTTIGTVDEAGAPTTAVFTSAKVAWEISFSLGARF